MSHYDVACLWHQLEKRLDTESILQEALGQVLLMRHRGIPQSRLEAQWLSTLILLKTIFDLQRVYLQANQPTASTSTILQPETIVAVTECLVNFSREQYATKMAEGAKYDKGFVSYLRQAVVSGLRAYQLIIEKRRLNDLVDRTQLKERLKACLEKWPIAEEIDQHLSRYLFEAVSDMTNADRPMSSVLCPSHPTLDLPDFSEGGSYISSSCSENTMECALKCINQKCSHWIRSFWLLTDLKLAIIAAAVQASATQELEILRVSRNTYEKMDNALRAGGQLSSRTEAFVEYLSWVEPAFVCQNHYACITSSYSATETVESIRDMYGSLTQHLAKRQRTVFDSNNALLSVRTRMEDTIRDWTSTTDADFSHATSNPVLQHTEMMAYILFCPQMHPVSYPTLERLIRDNQEEKGLHDLINGAELFSVFFKCEHCGPGTLEVDTVRRVRPFQDIVLELERLRVSNDVTDATHDSTRSERTFDGYTPATPLTEVLTPDHSSLNATSHAQAVSAMNHVDNRSFTSSKKRRFLPNRPVKAAVAPIRDLQLALSVDARSIIAWTPHLASCYTIRVETWSDVTIQAPDIVMVAGGVTKFAIVYYVQESTKYMLSVYRCHNGARLQDPVDLGERAHSMKFSYDGRQLVVGCSKHIHNFAFDGELWSSNHFTQPLRTPKERDSRQIDSQCISYSSDNLRLVVATRYKPSGEMSIGIYSNLPDTLDMKGFPGKLSLSSNRDWGLTGIVSLFPSGHLIWTASCDKAKLKVLRLDLTRNNLPVEKEVYDFPHARVGARIQCATVLQGSEPQFVLCNESNKVFTVKQSTVWEAELLTSVERPAVTSRRDMMSVASSHDGGIRLLWLQDNKGHLLSFRPGSRSPEHHDPLTIEMIPFTTETRP